MIIVIKHISRSNSEDKKFFKSKKKASVGETEVVYHIYDSRSPLVGCFYLSTNVWFAVGI